MLRALKQIGNHTLIPNRHEWFFCSGAKQQDPLYPYLTNEKPSNIPELGRHKRVSLQVIVVEETWNPKAIHDQKKTKGFMNSYNMVDLMYDACPL